MKVLIVGGGGREHALAWKIASSPRVDKVYCAPGNAGISSVAECVNIKVTEISSLINLVIKEGIELTVVGPEAALAAGIVDEFEKRGLVIFGPTMAAAEIESSKVFAKKIMQKYNIPTARGKIFTNPKEALRYIKSQGAPLVVKADGLAAGKGVIICAEVKEANEAIAKIMEERIFGEAGERVIVEECLKGEEASILVFTDGENVIPLVSSRDHKQIFDGDRGPNCYSEDTEILTEDGWKRFNKLKVDDKVAIFDVRSREIYFEKPSKKYWMKYKGNMVQFKHRCIDLLVTPNHRMLSQQRKGKRKITVREAKEFRGENYIYQSGIWKGKNPKFFVLPEYDYKFNRKFKKLKINFIDWVRFMGIYLSEGYVAKERWAKRVYICQTKKSKNFSKVEEIVKKTPFKFSYNLKHHKFRIDSTQLATYLERFGTSHKKYTPDYIKNSKREIIIDFLKAFNLSDGDIHYGKMRFCSSSKRLIDDIQEMIVKINRCGIITTNRRKEMVNPLNKKRYKANPVYSIEIKERNKASIRKNNIKLVKYNGMVGCVTVSTGFVVVRRNNRVAISGNTGGMGAYSPTPLITKSLLDRIIKEIIRPIILGMNNEGRRYNGVLYVGIMVTEGGPKVLEFNVRFGDPETQAVLPLLKSDILEPIIASIDGDLNKVSLKWENKSAVCVVIASKGYPGNYEKGKEIRGLNKLSDSEEVIVFHAGTSFENKKIVTNGGRVLGVTGIADTLNEAISKTYQAVEKIKFDGMRYRRDIGTANTSKAKKTIKTVLFVCSGNSCRSVMAEAFLRKLLSEEGRNEINVTSAGTLGIVGMEALSEVVTVMKEEGVDVSHHRSTPLTEELISEADLILIMERHHRESILNISPQADKKTFLLKEFSSSQKKGYSSEIYDPVGKPLSVYYETLAEIKESIIGFLEASEFI